jgi:hypothetical protein
LSLTPVSMSSAAFLLCFTFQNTNWGSISDDHTFDYDIHFNGDDSAVVWTLGIPREFNVSANSRTMAYVCGGYPPVTDCSAYWFGSYR